jgi:hypothetical protein
VRMVFLIACAAALLGWKQQSTDNRKGQRW